MDMANLVTCYALSLRWTLGIREAALLGWATPHYWMTGHVHGMGRTMTHPP